MAIVINIEKKKDFFYKYSAMLISWVLLNYKLYNT